ncbi:polymorphic toxin type 22 domain-containing protein, partial [Paraburkholderia sp. XV]
LNIASVQDTMASNAHQESMGGGFSISQGGGSASFSSQHGNATGSYAGVNEQAGIQAGDGGFNINVKGNTDLKGAIIASDAEASKNNLTTGTLTYSDIQNQSSYNAHSSGFSAGATTGDGGSNYSTHGPTSGKNAGGGAPMLSQNDSGSDSATTRSAISAGTINVTDSAHQTQDVASLNRDTSNTNGTVAKLPDVNNLLNNQADMMAAASAAGEAVSRRVGDFADSKLKEAQATGDQAGIDAWKEGGTARAEMQAAGGALVAGLAGGNALGGAAGAGIASIAAGKLNELSGAIAGSNPTGNAGMNQALGNIVANAIATGAGAAVGGNAGAVSAYNTDRYNRQLHAPEKTKAQQIASQAAAQGLKNSDGSPITEAQIENAMRAANNSQYGEIVATGVVVPLNATTPASAVYDTTGMKLATDSARNNYLVQDPSMLSTPSTALQALIVQSTGGAHSPYSWNPASTQTVATPKIDPSGPFSPNWNTGDYSAGFNAGGRGLAPDYMTVNGGALSANVSGVVNLYDGSLYAGGGVAMTNPSAVSYKPGFSTTFGYIFGARTAQDARNFIAGDGNQAFVSVPANMGVNFIGAITHGYGGATAIEIGVGQPGSLTYGVVPWGHTTQVTGQNK